MRRGATHLEAVGSVVDGLRGLGLDPILVGGMALVVLGSRRVTRDFDRGFELASRVDAAGEVTATIDNRRVATARLRLDAPASAYFLDPETGLRIDVLFDFPLPAATLGRRAVTVKARSPVLRMASEADLLRLKKIAAASRSSPGDAEDIAFLEARRPYSTVKTAPRSAVRPAARSSTTARSS